jgi:hypothetical protein
MEISTWTIELGWALLGVIIGGLLQYVFDFWSNSIVCALLGITSFVVLALPPASVSNQDKFFDVCMSVFVGHAPLVLWQSKDKIKQLFKTETRKELAFTFGIAAIVICTLALTVYWIAAVIKIYRYFYGLGPRFSIAEPLFIVVIGAMVLFIVHRVAFGTITPERLGSLLLLIVMSLADALIQYFVWFEIIGLFFVSDFVVSWWLLLGAIALWIVLSTMAWRMFFSDSYLSRWGL